MKEFIEYSDPVDIAELVKHNRVVLDFYGQTCGQCKMLGNALEKVKDKLQDNVVVVKIDAYKYPEISKEYGVASLPVVIIYADGNISNRIIGVRTPEFLLSVMNPK